MSDVVVRGQTFNIRVSRRDGRSVAHALRAETGDRFGENFTGGSDHEAVGCLTKWLEWQSDHAAALEALQEAERAYHRARASHMLASDTDRSSAGQERTECLERVALARERLDDIRSRRPD